MDGREPAAAVGSGRPEAGSSSNLRAIGLMMAATLAWTCGDAAMKLVSHEVPAGQSVFIRCLVSATILAVAAVWTGVIGDLRRAFVPLMGLRCAGDAGSGLFFQAALARMPFADIMGIIQLTPLMLTAASAVFLGARVGWRRWTAVAVGLAGALLVIKPGTSAFNFWAILAIVSVLGTTMRDVATRQLGLALSPLVILLLSQSAVAVAALGCLVFESWVWPSPGALAYLVVAGLLSLIGHLCVIHSLRLGELATVAPFRFANIVWAILLGLAIWGELPDVLSAIGIAIVVAAGLFTFHREHMQSGRVARGQ